MSSETNPNREKILNQFVWDLTRKHSWGGEVRFDIAVNNAFQDSKVGEAKRILRPLIKSYGVCFLHWSESDEEIVRMCGDRRVELAYYLRDEAGYTEFRIETYVSRFKDIDGGFDGTERPDVTYVEWPD